MKRKIITVLSIGALVCMLAVGCSGKDNQEETQAAAETVSQTETVSEMETASETETASEAASASESEEAEPAAALEDGVYTADFDTDSGMFHVNEAYEGKGTLTVEDGKMVIHVSLTSKNIVNLFAGLAEDAQKDGAELLQPTTDTVTYSDGTQEEVYGFDIPVPVLDEEFDVALVGTKGIWYDHKVSVSNPEKAE